MSTWLRAASSYQPLHWAGLLAFYRLFRSRVLLPEHACHLRAQFGPCRCIAAVWWWLWSTSPTRDRGHADETLTCFGSFKSRVTSKDPAISSLSAPDFNKLTHGLYCPARGHECGKQGGENMTAMCVRLGPLPSGIAWDGWCNVLLNCYSVTDLFL
jgi:hypothetical protein